MSQVQSTNYEVEASDRLALRVQEGYLRTSANQTHMEKSTDAFIKAQMPNIGTHPFLAGLAQVLRWNLESTTIVSWQCEFSIGF